MADDSTVKRRKRNEERRKQQSKDSKKPSSDDRTNEYKDYALVDPGKIEPGPDVLIDVPVVKVDKLEIEVDDLRAMVAVQAKVRKLLDLDVGWPWASARWNCRSRAWRRRRCSRPVSKTFRCCSTVWR